MKSTKVIGFSTVGILVAIVTVILVLRITVRDNKPHSVEKFTSIDYATTLFSNMRNRFNVPMYIAIMSVGYEFKHGLNATMVGDSTLKYSDWLFIEPQTDYTYDPGYPRIPNSTISICAPLDSSDLRYSQGNNYFEILRFFIDSTETPRVIYYHPELVLTRAEAFE